MKRIVVGAGLALGAVVAGSASADVVVLRGGGEIRGEVVERRPNAVVIAVGPGRLTLPLSRVLHIVDDTADIEIYRRRAAALAAGDVAGWVELGRWAQARDLLTLARGAFERALAFDPGNDAAHEGLGHVRLAGRWMSLEQASRAQGLVEFEGRWVSPGERAAALAMQEAEGQGRRAQREAEARAREAEARARAAEAEARRAEAEAEAARRADADARSGVPYPWVYGPGAVVVPPVLGPGGIVVYGSRHHGHHPLREHPVRPVIVKVVPVVPIPRDSPPPPQSRPKPLGF